jgi:hypothetical protein
MVEGDEPGLHKSKFRGISLIVESPTTQSKLDAPISLKFHIQTLLSTPLIQRSQISIQITTDATNLASPVTISLTGTAQ